MTEEKAKLFFKCGCGWTGENIETGKDENGVYLACPKCGRKSYPPKSEKTVEDE